MRYECEGFPADCAEPGGRGRGVAHGCGGLPHGRENFATLASEKQGYGNLMLTLEQQAAFVEELPGVFVPIAGGWGRMGMTHIRLAAASEDVLEGALRTPWKLRLDKNAKAGSKKTRGQATRTTVTKQRRKKR
jgi:hypothetical protein